MRVTLERVQDRLHLLVERRAALQGNLDPLALLAGGAARRLLRRPNRVGRRIEPVGVGAKFRHQTT